MEYKKGLFETLENAKMFMWESWPKPELVPKERLNNHFPDLKLGRKKNFPDVAVTFFALSEDRRCNFCVLFGNKHAECLMMITSSHSSAVDVVSVE